MMHGIESFKNWFSTFSGQYVIIGGTACDLLMDEAGQSFRATKDIDMVLIVENLTPEFGARFWSYIIQGGYEHLNKNTGESQYYRFSKPKSPEYPSMIELFSRHSPAIALLDTALLTPLPFGGEVSSLSALLMDEDYYQLLLDGKVIIDGISISDAAHLIPLKAKAWLDLSARKLAGEDVDSRNIKKHKNDVFRLSTLLSSEMRIMLPGTVYADLTAFLSSMEAEPIDPQLLGLRRQTKEDLLNRLAAAYTDADGS
jgi:hypothetical protein